MIVKHKYFLHFPKTVTDTPFVYNLVHDFNLKINIFRAKVTLEDEGAMVIEIEGEEEKIEDAKKYTEQLGIEMSTVDRGVRRDETKCTNCGNCLSHCPPHALHIADPRTRKVVFDEKLCVACGRCTTNCPMGACSTVFK